MIDYPGFHGPGLKTAHSTAENPEDHRLDSQEADADMKFGRCRKFIRNHYM